MKMWNWIKMIGLSACVASMVTMAQLMYALAQGKSWIILPDIWNATELVFIFVGIMVLMVEIGQHVHNWHK